MRHQWYRRRLLWWATKRACRFVARIGADVGYVGNRIERLGDRIYRAVGSPVNAWIAEAEEDRRWSEFLARY